MIIKSKIVTIGDDLITGLNNLNQQIDWVVKEFKKASKSQKTELLNRYKDTYIGGLLEQLMPNYKSGKSVVKCD